MENTATYNIQLPQEGVFWARMPGYPHWPVRFCSIPEAERILSLKNQKRQNQVPVYFLSSCEVAWVSRSSVEPFTAATAARRFDKQKFKVQKPYRQAFVEALRVAIGAGEVFEEAILSLVRASESAPSLVREDVCSVCRGSELSGDALLCDNCNIAETHLHCLTPQLSVAPEGNWYCDMCCEDKGLPPGYMPTGVTATEPTDTTPSQKPKSAPALASSTPIAPREASGSKRKKCAETAPASSGSGGSASRTEGTSVLETLQRLAAASGDVASPPRDSMDHYTSDEDASLRKKVPTTTSVLGKTNGKYNGTVRPCAGYEFPETCIVCDLGGKLQLCDYPGCRRSYHQTCIPKKVPTSVATAFEQTLKPDFDESCGQEEPWLCPAHFCVRCKAISSGNGMQELGARSLPSYLKHNGDHVLRKPLSSCAKCPMSICLDCERDIGGNIPIVLVTERIIPGEMVGNGTYAIDENRLLDNYDESCDVFVVFPSGHEKQSHGGEAPPSLALRMRLPGTFGNTETRSMGDDIPVAVGGRSSRRRGLINYSDNTPRKLPGQKDNADLVPVCLNCNSLSCELGLAKSLERLISHVCNSRLCLPFLRPLLPVAHNPCHGVANGSQSEGNCPGTDDARLEENSRDGTLPSNRAAKGPSGLNEAPLCPPDIISIIEKIRRLEYQSAGQVLCDLKHLRCLVKERMCEESGLSQNSKGIESTGYKQIEWAFDYLLEIAARYDDANQSTHRKLEKAIAAKLVREATQGFKGLRAARLSGSVELASSSKRPRAESDASTGNKRRKLDVTETEEPQSTTENGYLDIMPETLNEVCREVQGLWRLECETPIRPSTHTNNYIVGTKRNLSEWCKYLQVGQMPVVSKAVTPKTPLPYSDELLRFVEPSIVDLRHEAPTAQIGRIESRILDKGKVSWLRSVGIEDMATELEAAEIMTGIRYTNIRENVSLQHSVDVNSGPLLNDEDIPGFHRSDSPQNMILDDSWILLEQLRETSRRSLLLSAQLQHRIRKQQHNELDTIGNVTIGEGKIISELKVANDNLRWRLQQKARTICAMEEVSSSLKDDVADMKRTIQQKDELLAKYRSDIERLKGNSRASNTVQRQTDCVVEQLQQLGGRVTIERASRNSGESSDDLKTASIPSPVRRRRS